MPAHGSWGVWIWLAATLAHFLLTARLTNRWLGDRTATRDEQFFSAALMGVGSLSLVLHVVAVTAGLSLTKGLVALAAWHALVFAAARRIPARSVAAERAPLVQTVAESIALAVLAGVLLTWIDLASANLDISGADAAHYHVPVAVNLALGVNPFGLPATPHLYPMVGSLLDSWFLLPTGDVLLVDLAISLPFVLTIASIVWLFRLCTGLSGLAWAFWVGLLLFSTPLFRQSSLISADLWFTSGFLGLTAVLTAVWARRRWRASDVALGGLALGLVVGTKATGAPAGALLVAAFGLAAVARRLIRDPEGFRGCPAGRT